MKNFYLGIVLANPFIASVSSISGQEVMPNSVAEPERSDHPEHNAQPSSYEAGAAMNSDGDVESLCIGQSVGKSQVLAPQGVQTGRVAHGPSEANSGASQQPRGEAAQTNATQPVASPNFDSVIKELLQICPPLKPWQTPLQINARHQERAVDDAIADFFDPAPMFLKEPLRRAG